MQLCRVRLSRPGRKQMTPSCKLWELLVILKKMELVGSTFCYSAQNDFISSLCFAYSSQMYEHTDLCG